MKKLSLTNLNLDERKKVIGGADHYELVCFDCGGPDRICLALRVGIGPEPC